MNKNFSKREKVFSLMNKSINKRVTKDNAKVSSVPQISPIKVRRRNLNLSNYQRKFSKSTMKVEKKKLNQDLIIYLQD